MLSFSFARTTPSTPDNLSLSEHKHTSSHDEDALIDVWSIDILSAIMYRSCLCFRSTISLDKPSTVVDACRLSIEKIWTSQDRMDAAKCSNEWMDSIRDQCPSSYKCVDSETGFCSTGERESLFLDLNHGDEIDDFNRREGKMARCSANLSLVNILSVYANAVNLSSTWDTPAQ